MVTPIRFVYHFLKKKTFCGFSMGRNQYWAGRVYDLCVYYMTGTPEGSTESGFMEELGIEPATPGANFINEFTACFCLKNIVRSSYVKNRVTSNY